MAEATRHPLLVTDDAEESDELVAEEQVSRARARPTPLFVASTVLVVAGVVALALGWWGVSGTSEVWQQLPYVVSGALGGLGLIGLGILAYVAHSHAADRRVLADVIRRLDELEMALAGEFDDLAAHVNGAGHDERSSDA